MGRLAQGRLGYASFQANGGSAILIPVYDWNIQSRRNRVTGDPVGNTWSTNYADGMITSRMTARILCRKNTAEAFSTDFLSFFVNRTFSDGLDDTTGFQILCNDGRTTHRLGDDVDGNPSFNAKPESFTLTIAKGSPVGLQVSFVCPTPPAKLAGVPADYNKTVDQSKVMMFDAASFAHGTYPTAGTPINELYNVEVTYSNNHVVNAPLNGTLFAESFDAGTIRCGATFTVRAHNLTELPFANEDIFQILLALGGGHTFSISLTEVVPDTDLDANANVGASYRTWQCLVLGKGVTPSSGTAVSPLSINIT